MPKDKKNILKGRTLLDLADGVLVVIDQDARVLGINRAGCNMLGITEEQAVGHDWFEDFVIESEREKSRNYFEKVLEGEKALGIYVENCLVTSKGTSEILRWNSTLLRDDKGYVYGVLVFGSEVGVPQDLKDRLKMVNERFEEYEQMKSEFVVTVSHELRTPLTIFKNIVSNALAGVSGKIKPKLRKDLETANKAVDRLAGIISDFLDISRIEAGKLQFRATPIIVQSAVTDAVEMLKSVIEDNNMDIEFVMPDHALFINADYGKIVQIFDNLFENAAKFVPDCGGHLIIRVRDAGLDVAIEIEDNGPGIETKDVNKIFDGFIQINRQVGAGEHGTGLGLTIARELVGIHGGSIWAENVPTGGARICILFPKYSRSKHTDADLAETGIGEMIESFKEQVDSIRQLCAEGDGEAELIQGGDSDASSTEDPQEMPSDTTTGSTEHDE
jgi:PAS domain S-box-containing protein